LTSPGKKEGGSEDGRGRGGKRGIEKKHGVVFISDIGWKKRRKTGKLGTRPPSRPGRPDRRGGSEQRQRTKSVVHRRREKDVREEEIGAGHSEVRRELGVAWEVCGAQSE